MNSWTSLCIGHLLLCFSSTVFSVVRHKFETKSRSNPEEAMTATTHSNVALKPTLYTSALLAAPLPRRFTPTNPNEAFELLMHTDQV